MMTIKTIRLLQLLAFTVVASQMIFYLLILGDALKQVSIEGFLEQRRAVDPLMQARWKFAYYACGLVSIAAIAVSAKNPGSWFFITSIIALLCVVTDVVLSLRGNGPINHMVNIGTLSSDFDNWEAVRAKWLQLVQLRGLFTVGGLLSLLVGVVMDR